MSEASVALHLTTIGHGTLAVQTFIRLLDSAGVQNLVDVRSVPTSRHNPQFARDVMVGWMSDAKLQYRWVRPLGGFRKPMPASRNVALRHAAFRGYADYMATAPFWQALDEVLEEARVTPTAIMCSESVWWRCHRRLIADAAVLTRDAQVVHIFHDGRLVPHRPTDGVRLEDGRLVYDVVR